MKRIPIRLAAILVLAAAGPLSADAADAPAAPDADQLLRQMSDKLAGAATFRFEVRREISDGLAGGDGLHSRSKIKVLVQRPDKFEARATVPDDTRCFYFNGKQLTMADLQQKVYSTVPLAATLDELPSKIAADYGFLPPMAELLISDLYQDLAWRAKSIEYRGEGTIHSGFLGLHRVHCYRIGLTGTQADSEIWIGKKDLLPRQWDSTVQQPEGKAFIHLEFSDWDLKAKAVESDFVYQPQKGAVAVPMMTRAEMEAAKSKNK
ncbi:MAG: DUF2092 domain-containing protein [Verrucomicrobiota bacterium]